MAGVGSSEVRQRLSESTSGSIDSGFQPGGQSVDVSRFVQETPQPIEQEDTGDNVSSIVDSAFNGSSMLSNSRAARDEGKNVEPVKQEAVPATSAAATMRSNPLQVQQDAKAPAPQPHPGGAFILNMENGMLQADKSKASSIVDSLDLDGSNLPANVDKPTRAAKEVMPEANPLWKTPEEKVAADAKTVDFDVERAELEAAGRDEIRREGIVERPESPSILTPANRTFGKIKELLKDKMDRRIKHKTYSGMSFWETMFSKPDLMPHCVSLGSDSLYESLREPNSGVLELVNSKLPPEEQLTLEQCLDNIQLLVNAINSVNIEVTLDKSPVNVNHSIQVRVLRAHRGRGIGLHPTQTKGFNADYDGDTGNVNLDQDQLVRYARAMDRLVSIEGKPLIDPEFFPLERIEDRGKALKLLKEKNLSWNPLIAENIIDAYIGASNNGDWVTLLRKIDEIAEREALIEGTRNEHAASILMSLYDFSRDMRALAVAGKLDNANEEMSQYQRINPGTDPFVLNLINITDEIIAGRAPMSFTEFNRYYNKYYGDVEGKKNVPFRLLADYAKAIKRTDLITIGSDLFGFKLKDKHLELDEDSTVSVFDLYQFMCVAGFTKQISGRCHMGSRQLAVSTQVRAMVFRDVPLRQWTSNEDFRAWIREFIASYNLNTRMLHLAEMSFRGGMKPVDSKSSKFDGVDEKTLDGLADALVKVYGHKTVGAVFPGLIRGGESKPGETIKHNSGQTIARHYRNMTLTKFVMNNRMVFRSDRSKKNPDGTSYTWKQSLDDRIAKDDFTPMDVLMMIADSRTKQLSDYNKNWVQMTKDHHEAIIAVLDYENANDVEEYASNIMEMISVMSPEMFLYYGMESPQRFRSSKYGKKLLAAKTVEEYQSCLVSMMVEYRLGKTSQILAEMKDLEEVENGTGIEELEIALDREQELLASSSMVWKTIIRETLNGNKNFKRLMRDEGVHAGWEVMYAKQSFWTRPAAEKEKYYSLMTFLKSSEPLEVKLAVLADVTRVSENYPSITPNEILGQLAYHPDKLHAGNRFDMDGGIRSDIDALKESSDLLSSYKNNTPEKIREQAEDFWQATFREEFEGNQGRFISYLNRLATDPGYAVHVDTIFAADAVASVFDKTYADSEKIHQQASINGYHGCICFQRNGGYFTHLYMADNAVVNTVGYDQITPRDLLLVLSDPTVEINSYDEFGTPVVLSRETLCGGNSDEDVIAYLRNNPRVTLMCKRSMAGIKADVEGSTTIKAIKDVQLMDSALYQTFSLLNDRPRFLAIASLFTKSDWEVGRNISESVNQTIIDLCNFLIYEAQSGKTGMQLIDDIRKRTGLNAETFAKLRTEGRYDSVPNKNDFDAATNLYQEVLDELCECISLVRENGIVSPSVQALTFDFNIDQSSMIAYYDVRQQISGARTETMIGVEGSETKKNLVLKVGLRAVPDFYTMSSDGETVIPLIDELEQASDQSLVHSDALRTGSISKFLEIKRENGAETYNAKYKKYGDDGTNSMIKFIRMAKRAVFKKFGKTESTNIEQGTWSIEDGQELVKKIKACATKAEAVPILAQALIDADIRLGYIKLNEAGKIEDESFVKSDYWNRAHFMLGENSDGTLVIRTLEQLSAAARTRLSDEAVMSGDADLVSAELIQIFATVGTDTDIMLTRGNDNIIHDIVSGIKLPPTMGNKYRVDRALRQRSSSTERNYSLLYHICKDYIKRMGITEEAIPSRQTINAISTQKMRELNDDRDSWAMAQTLKGLAYPKDKYDEENGFELDAYGDRTYLYDYIGKATDADLRLIPGPKSLVLFDKMNSVVYQQCFDYGITIAVTDSVYGDLPDYVAKNAILVSNETWRSNANSEYKATENLWIIPFFDIRLNEGISASPIMPAPAEMWINPDNSTIMVESTTGEFGSGDAVVHITKEFAGRINVLFRGTQTFESDRLFPNAKQLFENRDYELDYASAEEVQRYILNAELDVDDLVMHGKNGDKAVIDIGVLGDPDDPAFEREKARFAIRLQEYKSRLDIDSDSIITGDCGYDSIVGFVKIHYLGAEGGVVFAPIWPFHLEESGDVPVQFSVDKFTLDKSTDSFILEWKFTGSVEDQLLKYFEGIGASNKFITSGERIRSRQLENGLYIDGAYASASIATRLFASNKRINTMISVMMMTRLDPNYSYNFAEDSGAFPNNDKLVKLDEDGNVIEIDIKDALLNMTLGIADWKAIRDMNIPYHVDPEINEFVKWWVNKCIDFGTVNPSTLLATRTPDGITWPKITEFEAFFDPSLKFQEHWMKFMHNMMPTLIPESIDADASKCLFVPVQGEETDEDYGVLQMRVPYWQADGTPYTQLQNVYISMGFFGDDFSGFKKVNFNAYRRSIDNLNVASQVTGNDLVQLLTFARAGMTDVKPATRIEAMPDNAIKQKSAILNDDKNLLGGE